MAYSKKAINERYDKLRAQLKSGTIDQKKFKASANRLYELYHSDANKAARNAKPKTTAAKPPVATPKPKPKSQSNGNGTYGKPLQSNPPLKSQKKGKAGMPYQGEFPGTPKKEKPKRTAGAGTRGAQGGSRARVNRKRTKPAEGSTKTIQVGPKRVTMVYKGGKWVRKNGK